MSVLIFYLQPKINIIYSQKSTLPTATNQFYPQPKINIIYNQKSILPTAKNPLYLQPKIHYNNPPTKGDKLPQSSAAAEGRYKTSGLQSEQKMLK